MNSLRKKNDLNCVMGLKQILLGALFETRFKHVGENIKTLNYNMVHFIKAGRQRTKK